MPSFSNPQAVAIVAKDERRGIVQQAGAMLELAVEARARYSVLENQTECMEQEIQQLRRLIDRMHTAFSTGKGNPQAMLARFVLKPCYKLPEGWRLVDDALGERIRHLQAAIMENATCHAGRVSAAKRRREDPQSEKAPPTFPGVPETLTDSQRIQMDEEWNALLERLPEDPFTA